LAALLTPGNQRWAPQAAVLALSLARTAFTRTGAPNRYAWHDTGLALANLIVEATARGLIAHPMAGFDAAAARSTFAIPEEFDPVAMIAIGYPGDPAALPEDLQARELAPRQRRPLEETVFASAWGQTAPFVSV
jgi:nitroreductase